VLLESGSATKAESVLAAKSSRRKRTNNNIFNVAPYLQLMFQYFFETFCALDFIEDFVLKPKSEDL
jgi:hypothetical protein